VDHFKCYQRSSDPGLEPQQIGLEDDFDAKRHTVKLKPTLVCNPVSVDGSVVVNKDDHLACYALSDVDGEPTFEPLVGVTISDGAFETSDIDVVKSRLLCERATAQLVL
jgi:hypothetical protein